MPASLVASPLGGESSLMQQAMADWKSIPNACDNLPWYRNKGLLKLNFFLSIIFVGMILNGYDGTLIAGLQAFPAWHEDLGDPDGARIGLLNACSSISGLIVGPVIMYIDDNFGRKWGIRFYGVTIVAGTAISSAAGVPGVNGYALFVVGRFIIGFGLASFLMTSLVLIQEITHPRTRSFVCQSWNSYYILGSVIAAWVNFGTSYISNSWSWRIPYLIQLPMAVFLLVAVQFVPESPRFLIAKGRDQEALNFLIDYHGNGDRDDQLVAFEYNEICVAIRLEQEAKAEKWGTILKSRSNRHRLGLAALMIFCTNLSGSSIIYFYYVTVFELVGITDPTTQTGINAGLTIFTWFCQIAAVYAGKRVGRKTIILWVWPMILLGLVGLCVSGGIFAQADDGNTQAGVATVVLVWLYLGAFNFSNPVLYSYPAEVQTFSMRSKGLLVWNTISNLEYAYVVFVDAIALDSIGYKYYIVYMPLVIIQWCLVKYYMVETRGYTLEEVALAFDGSNSSLANVNLLPRDTEPGAEYDATKGQPIEESAK